MTYELYKPLRNHLRKYALLPSLYVIRAYMQNLQFGIEFPRDIEVPLDFLSADKVNKNVYEWELETLVREMIINAGDNPANDMRRYSDFASAVNKIKALENAIGGHRSYRKLFSDNIHQELFRIAHRQFIWQRKQNRDDFLRYYVIFGSTEMNSILESYVGYSARQIFTLGLALTGTFLDKFKIDLPIRISLGGVMNEEQARQIIGKYSIKLDELKARIISSQSYDQDFAYVRNPLLETPLVLIEQQAREGYLIAPVPTYVLRRFTDGIYYDVCDAPGFSNAFGSSFQFYIGEVLKTCVQGAKVNVLPEEKYRVGSAQKHSVDWIFDDGTAAIFMECKAKRLRFDGKVTLVGNSSLQDDLAKMAEFVVQVYKTLVDALNGCYPHWKWEGKPVYPMVVTLEEWYAYGEKVVVEIDSLVRSKMEELGLDVGIVDKSPYSICSARELEYASYVIAKVGIERYMAEKSSADHFSWGHQGFISNYHQNETIGRPELFPAAWREILTPP